MSEDVTDLEVSRGDYKHNVIERDIRHMNPTSYYSYRTKCKKRAQGRTVLRFHFFLSLHSMIWLSL